MEGRATRYAAAFLVIVCSTLNAVVILMSYTENRAPEHFTYHGQDFPEVLPLPWKDLPLVEHTIEESVHFEISQDYDDVWKSSASAGRGFVRLGPESRLYELTMFHELHCLRALNYGNALGPVHIHHCLNYLRQGVLCGADLTLEAGDFAERDFTRDKVGSTHTCRDWSAVYPLMEENERRWNETRTRLGLPLPD
ncbi:hypothetical protein AURDEDRAFT_184310 [Auricularia subglabra TFB-10046 SS5]|nr:hypothetical protein AURDEDRAFT_184310 [Auricularia subglabra TFB-10046 SS5]